MFYKSNTWTAYIKEWAKYKAPLWTDGGYYALTDEEMAEASTVNVNDLLIFADIEDDVPRTITNLTHCAKNTKTVAALLPDVKYISNTSRTGNRGEQTTIEVIKA